jgi:hypothetical protein
MYILIIAAAILAEVLIALLAGGFLHDCSELADSADSEALSTAFEDSAETVRAAAPENPQS